MAIRIAVFAGFFLGIPALVAVTAGAIMSQLGASPNEMVATVKMSVALPQLAVLAIFRYAKVRRYRRFRAREVLSEQEWCDRHYRQSEFSAIKIRSILSAIGSELAGDVRITQLRPHDRLEDLGFTYWGFPHVLTAWKLAITVGDDFELDPLWKTLDDVIVAAHSREVPPTTRGRTGSPPW